MGALPVHQCSPDRLNPCRGLRDAAHRVGEQSTVAARTDHVLHLSGKALVRRTTAAARHEHQTLVAAGQQHSGAGIIQRHRRVAVPAGIVQTIGTDSDGHHPPQQPGHQSRRRY